jgi:hypothetical protein
MIEGRSSSLTEAKVAVSTPSRRLSQALRPSPELGAVFLNDGAFCFFPLAVIIVDPALSI